MSLTPHIHPSCNNANTLHNLPHHLLENNMFMFCRNQNPGSPTSMYYFVGRHTWFLETIKVAKLPECWFRQTIFKRPLIVVGTGRKQIRRLCTIHNPGIFSLASSIDNYNHQRLNIYNVPMKAATAPRSPSSRPPLGIWIEMALPFFAPVPLVPMPPGLETLPEHVYTPLITLLLPCSPSKVLQSRVVALDCRLKPPRQSFNAGSVTLELLDD
jgi:hypothetical protein